MLTNPIHRRLNDKTIDGFTLIEVMLAMVITAFVALLAYSGLSTSISVSQEQETYSKKISSIQLPLTVLGRDIRHAVARSIIDEYGEKVAAMAGDALDKHPLKLTRRGWDNPRGLPRGDLQRVRYVFENEELWRESWSVLDRLSEQEGQQRTLLMEGVLDFQISFLDQNSSNATASELGGEWVAQWDDLNTLPKAVEIKLEIESFGEVRRVYSITHP